MEQATQISSSDSVKSSDIPWADHIPSTWLSLDLKYASKINPCGDRAKKDDVVTFLPMEAVSVKGDIDNSRVSERRIHPSSLTEFKRNDIILAKITPCFENGKAAYLNKLKTEKGIGSTEFHVVRPNTKILNPKYTYYLVTNTEFRRYAGRFMEGSAGQKRVTTPFLANMKFPIPDLNTQARITNFLDQKTAEIDEAIAKKQRLIGLLKEQAAILINKAVTKGLNPNAPMRDSEVEWIGDVPKHWVVKRAKYLFHEVDERSKTGEEELLSVSHMTGVTPRSEKNINMFMAEDYSGSKLCQKDDLVFNIMWAWMGALGVSGLSGIVSPSYGVYRQQETGMFNAWYLEHLVRSGQYVSEYNRRSTGLHSSRLRLYSHMFFDMEIGFPSREEQDQIEQTVAEKTSYIYKTIQAVTVEIDKINEFRNVIISEAVTGKIKF